MILIGLNGDDNTTILMCAAKGAMPEVVPIALNKGGCNVNDCNFDGNTALMIAAQFGSVSVATELLRNHCDLNIVNKKKQNALIICSLYGSSQIAAMLTTLGSNIDVQDKKGMTALMYAASNGHQGIIANLIKYGANIDIKDNEGLTAIEHANKNGKFEIVKMIKNGTLQDVTDILQGMEILKQKNRALTKNIEQLNQINNELSDRVNATELQRNQIQKKFNETMQKMKKFNLLNHGRKKSDSPSTNSPSNKIKGKLNSMFHAGNHSPNNKKQKKSNTDAPRPPSKDIKL